MRWLKRGAWTLAALALLAIAGAAAVAWVATTQSGAAWLVQQLVARAPTLAIASSRGTLLAGLTLEGIRLRTARDELDIESLALDWNPRALLAGTLSFDDARATRTVYRRVPGVATAGGGPPRLPWPLRLERASVTVLSVTVAERTLVFDDTRFAGTYGSGRLDLEQVTTRWGAAAFATDASFGLLDGISFDVAGDWSAPLAGVPSSGSVTLTGTWPELRIHHELATPFTATSDGTLGFDGPFNFDLINEWRETLAWPGVDEVTSDNGRLMLAGTLDDYRFEGTGAVRVLDRDASFAVDGTGDRLELAVAELDLATPTPQGGGSLRGSGAVSLADRSANLAVTANGFDPAWLTPAWTGRLEGTTTLEAGLLPQPSAALDAIDLRGTLRGYPVTLRGAAAFPEPGSVRLEPLRLDSGANRVVLTGALDDTSLELAVDAELEQIDLLVPDAGGSLTADLAVSGTWQEPHARGQLSLRDLSFAGATIGSLVADGEIGLAPAARVALTIEGAAAVRGPVRVNEMRVAIEGTTAAHTLLIDAADEDWNASIAATGGLARGIWRGVADSVDIDEQILGPWRLEAPTAVAVGRGFATLANSCLLHVSNARWCTELDFRGTREDRLVVSGQNFDLATLRPLLPPTVRLSGIYQFSGSVFDLMGEPRGALALTGGRTQARILFGEEQAFSTELAQVQAGMTLNEGRAELAATLRSTTGGNADLRASIADVRSRDSAIDGDLRIQWPDLGFLTLLSPDLEQVSGALDVDLDVAGSIDEPTLDGRAALSNGRISIPIWGLVVEAIEATAVSSDGSALVIDATGRAGDGVLTLAGRTQLDADAGWPTRLTLRGDGVRIVQRADAEIFASPNLTIDLALPVVTVTGSVHVPRASLEVVALPAQAVAPSPDAVVHGQQIRANRSQPLQLRTAIELTLGDDVRYSALNLDTTVGGQLRIATEPNASANATGTLRLDGTYDAYGQRLNLERGQLLFSGPLDNPGLDVRAIRKLETTPTATATEVGVELTGTLRQPNTRIVSTPAMSEADALSYLLFGRPVTANNGMGADETTTLQTAALSLGLQQALPVVQRFGNSLGLDELTVQSTTTDAGELMAGKYISPKIFLRYSYGLFNRIGGLLLRFDVNDRFSVETRSGEFNSVDFLFTVEKD